MSQEAQDPKVEAQVRALNTLVQGVRVAQAKGAYTLEESASLLAAIKTFEVEQKPTAVPVAEPAPVAQA